MNKKYNVEFEQFENNDYNIIEDHYELYSNNDYEKALNYFNKEKFKLNKKEGLSLNVLYFNNEGDWKETEALKTFTYLDLQDLKVYELHIFESLEHDFLTVEKCKEEIKNMKFYREDAQEISFENDFPLNYYSNHDDECMVIIKRLSNNDFKVIELLKV